MALRSILLAAMIALPLPAQAAQESFVEIRGPSGLLKGTMLSPDQAASAPVVLIIPGSGPTDRDGNSPLGVKASTYRLLAQALAERGVVSVRIDKRGMFASAGAGDPNAVTIADYAADTHAWMADLRRRTGARCIWLAGHSEGALVALSAAQDRRDLCGLVLISAPGRKLSEVLREQLKANPADNALLPDATRIIDELEAGRHVRADKIPAPLMRLFNPAVQGFLIDLFRHDPAAMLKAYPGPVLIIQGDADLQVPVADAERLAQARPGVRLRLFPGVNHVLKTAPMERGGNVATYADPSLPLADGIGEAIAGFVKSN